MQQILEYCPNLIYIDLPGIYFDMTNLPCSFVKRLDKHMLLNKIYGNMSLFKLRKSLIDKKYFDHNEGLYVGCACGNMDFVKLMMDKGADRFDLGLYRACEGGHMDLVKFMIENGANDWDNGFGGAYHGGHLRIVKLMINKGVHPDRIRAYSNIIVEGSNVNRYIRKVLKKINKKNHSNYF